MSHAAPPDPPVIFPGFAGLDDLELLKLGLIPSELVPLLDQPGLVVDAEGVSVALVDSTRRVTWMSPRSSRPFEALHLSTIGRNGPVAVINDIAGLERVPESVAAMAVMASLDGDENAAALKLVQSAHQLAKRLGCSMLIVPLGANAAARQEKVRCVLDVLGHHTVITDCTNDPPAEASDESGGIVVLFTGLSGSGKSTLARALKHRLVEDYSQVVTLLDGDVVRRHLSSGLGFSVQDRETNVSRIGWVAAEIARHGGWAICSPIAPFEHSREEIEHMVRSRGGRFVLVHVATPLLECEKRDRKGLYARARAGQIPDFTGISSPYEIPTSPTLRLDTTGRDVESLVQQVLDVLDRSESLR